MARKLPAATRKKLQRGFALLAVLGLLLAIVVVAMLDRRVTQQFEGRSREAKICSLSTHERVAAGATENRTVRVAPY